MMAATIDSHCHPQFPELRERTGELAANMRQAGVAAAVAVCTRLEEADDLLAMANRHPQFHPTLGVHPNEDASAACDPDAMADMLRCNPQFVAVGEAGLDYFRDTCDRHTQAERFAAQIELALAVGKPLIVHTRDSIDDAIDMLESPARRGLRAVLHCFTGTRQQAQRAWDLGLHVSYTGIVTFKSAADVLATAAAAPLELSMIETDAPYLAPSPHRGQVNEPAWVRLVGERIAAARGADADEYLAAVADTCRSFYGIGGRAS